MRSLAQAAIASGRPVSGDPATVKWMTSVGMLESGRLADSMVTYTTVLSKPVRCEDVDSRYAIKKRLEAQGWAAADSAGDASLTEKKFSPAAPLDYFLLLKHQLGRLTEYDASFNLKHTQGKGYYEALSVWCETNTESKLQPMFCFIK